jgi:hypothetical protein
MLRYLNMFVLIGIALIIISLLGFATGNKLLTEPGQTPDPNAWLIYLGAGVLMLFNGALSILQSPPQAARPAPPRGAKPESRSEASSSTEAESV